MLSATFPQKLAFCVLLVTLIALPAWPQASTGSVSGTVRDQIGRGNSRRLRGPDQHCNQQHFEKHHQRERILSLPGR